MLDDCQDQLGVDSAESEAVHGRPLTKHLRARAKALLRVDADQNCDERTWESEGIQSRGCTQHGGVLKLRPNTVTCVLSKQVHS